jgi:hypothetical protein
MLSCCLRSGGPLNISYATDKKLNCEYREFLCSHPCIRFSCVMAAIQTPHRRPHSEKTALPGRPKCRSSLLKRKCSTSRHCTSVHISAGMADPLVLELSMAAGDPQLVSSSSPWVSHSFVDDRIHPPPIESDRGHELVPAEQTSASYHKRNAVGIENGAPTLPSSISTSTEHGSNGSPICGRGENGAACVHCN